MDTVTHTVQVDSRDRDPNVSANNYVMYLTEPVRQIKEVIIRDIQVPNSTYNVVDGKNEFQILTPLPLGVNVTVSPGSYSGLDLATHIFNITTSLVETDPNWNVVYDTGSKKFIFTQGTPFSVQFVTGSEDLADTMGFNTLGPFSSATVTPTYYGNDITLQTNFLPSDRIANLVKDKYFYLAIEELSDPRVQTAKRPDYTLDVNNLSQGFEGNNLSRIFGKVPVYAGPGNDVFFDRNSTFKLVRSYMSPLSSLSRLSIKWMDYAGTLIEFNGLDENSFTLELVCENREKGW